MKLSNFSSIPLLGAGNRAPFFSVRHTTLLRLIGDENTRVSVTDAKKATVITPLTLKTLQLRLPVHWTVTGNDNDNELTEHPFTVNMRDPESLEFKKLLFPTINQPEGG